MTIPIEWTYLNIKFLKQTVSDDNDEPTAVSLLVLMKLYKGMS